MRKSGILMHITSLPSKYGIGTLGKEAYDFADFLHASGQHLWQILPIGPTSYGDSPYQSFSSFAGNPLLIDLEDLIEQKLLTKAECDKINFGENELKVDYEKQFNARYDLLKKAYSRFEKTAQFRAFCDKEAYWLNDYALYMKVKYENKQKAWLNWSDDLILREWKAIDNAIWSNAEEIEYWKFIQYQFDLQYKKLKEYCNDLDIEIIGDLPIYVALDSADTWANPEIFQLDKDKKPKAVAGCPPDYFSKTGQLWGNPLYDWDALKKTGYKWWIDRIKKQLERFDILRIDHFRAFDTYYSIPFGNKTAEKGEWKQGPGMEFFNAVRNSLGDIKIIAEDLGELFDSVRELLDKTGYPGIKVLQFAFDGKNSDYLPHNHTRNCVVYTGTHDNDTTVGWFNTASKAALKTFDEYFEPSKKLTPTEVMIRAAFSSVADTVIIPMQDYLELDTNSRMNTPSTLGGNWEWRIEKDALTKALSKKILNLTDIYSR